MIESRTASEYLCLCQVLHSYKPESLYFNWNTDLQLEFGSKEVFSMDLQSRKSELVLLGHL